MFAHIGKAGVKSERNVVIFYVYRNVSIKSTERMHIESDEGVMFPHIMSDHRIKSKLVKFMVEDCKRPHLGEKYEGKVLYVTSCDKCFKLSAERSEEVNEVKTAQEEADTRILLHAKHAAADYGSITIVTDDTDVLILCIAVQARIGCNLRVTT